MINKKTFRVAISAIFVAIILVQTFILYIGYIRILPGLPSITTIPLTVALAGCLMTRFWSINWFILGLIEYVCCIYATR